MNPRRTFLKQAAMAGGAAIAVPLESLWRAAHAHGRREAEGYGPLRPALDETTGLPLLELPEGFRYLTYGWTGDPMTSGLRTPARHDGMATFAGPDGQVVIIRNHELPAGRAFDPGLAYDPTAGGGTTTLTFDPKAGRFTGARSSLAGTLVNCAGGPTPWGSWLTCEETTLGPEENPALQKKHGYIFEVPVDGRPSLQPLVAMGRFYHEAIAVDPDTGIVYETEDRRRAGFYRFTPKERGRLGAGGKLEMLAVDGRPQFDTRTGQRGGTRYGVHWVEIAEPDRAHHVAADFDDMGVLMQGLARGGAIFGRLEGAWYVDGRVFITATNGGNSGHGQVWEYHIRDEELRLVFESPGEAVLNGPDNLAVSPRGGLVICEDNGVNPRLHGLTRDGQIVRFARNTCVMKGERNGFTGDFRDREFCGATFSPDGQWLFVNIQTPGLTIAITGPWEAGIL